LALFEGLNMIEENREIAIIKLAEYQQMFICGYNKNMKTQEFILGDLILRKVTGNTQDPSWRKLGLNWEGLYRVTLIAGKKADN